MFYIMRSHHRNLCTNAAAKIDIHKISLKNQKAKTPRFINNVYDAYVRDFRLTWQGLFP